MWERMKILRTLSPAAQEPNCSICNFSGRSHSALKWDQRRISDEAIPVNSHISRRAGHIHIGDDAGICAIDGRKFEKQPPSRSGGNQHVVSELFFCAREWLFQG